jgi:glyoxylase-like metal-dependent hydrolase (beta-lactamase superfamily II)
MKTLKKVAKWIGLIGLGLVAIVAVFYFIYVKPVLNKIEATRIVDYDKNLTIYEGGGGNSGILVSDSVVLVIDSKMGDGAEALAAKVKELAGSKPILVVNTHYHIDHSAGNNLYPGQTILAGGGYTPETWKKEAKEEDMPTQWLKDKMIVKMGDDTATIFTLNMKIHTVGDVFVYLRHRKMLFVGDVILNGQVPSVANGDVEGYLVAFDKLQHDYDIRKIVPGHGVIGGIDILENFRQYFNDMKLAANDNSKREAMIEKYNSWTHVPLMMSSGNVIDGFKKEE